MKTIITVQHAQSHHHANGMVGSWTDWGLTDLGFQQAENIGKNLACVIGGKTFVMYSSDLKRARQTAETITECLKIEPVLTDVLRERNLGEAVGKTKEWAGKNAIVQEKTVDAKPFKGAESRRDVWNRLLPFFNDIMNSQDENILLVSHGDVLSIFNAIWLGLQPEDLNRCNMSGSAGGVSFFSKDSDGKRIINRLNDMSFVRE